VSRRALPLLPDALPLYASRQQLVAAMAGTADGQKRATILFDVAGFPTPSALIAGLYYVPAVLQFVEDYEARKAPATKGIASSWQETSKRRA
jgi:hypothetical protein